MARNFAAAVERDGHILADVGAQEQIAIDDRTLAQRLCWCGSA